VDSTAVSLGLALIAGIKLRKSIRTKVILRVRGEEHTLRALIDFGAKSDFLSKTFADRVLFIILDTPYTAYAVDGRNIPVYGQVNCELSLQDSRGTYKASMRRFLLTAIKDYDLILGIP